MHTVSTTYDARDESAWLIIGETKNVWRFGQWAANRSDSITQVHRVRVTPETLMLRFGWTIEAFVDQSDS